MPSDLDSLGTLVYNGVHFGNFTVSEFSARPVYDRAERTVIYVVYEFRVSTKIIVQLKNVGPPNMPELVPDLEASDFDLDTFQNLLLTPGGPLEYSGRGGGRFLINVSTVRDVVWGPKPRLFSLKNLGGGSVEIDWAVEVAIPRCEGIALHRGALMEVNYRLSFNQDNANFTRRVYTGYYRIPQTREQVFSRKLIDSADADAYFNKVIPSLPDGFRRGPVERTLDESKCRCDFSWVDEELPTDLPDDVVHISASHRLQSGSKNLNIWTGTINATIEMAKPVPRKHAYNTFVKLVQDRSKYTDAYGKVPKFASKEDAAKPFFLPVQFSFGEPDIFGRNIAEFSLTYTMCTSQDSFIKASGVWTKPNDSLAMDSRWRQGAGNIANFPRGWANARFSPKGDAIIDLCYQPSTESSTETRALTPKNAELNTIFNLPLPKPNNSWLMCTCGLRWEQEDMLCTHKPLQSTMVATLPRNPEVPVDPKDNGNKNFGGAAIINSDNGNSGYASMYSDNAGQPTGVFQYRSAPDIAVVLEGSAIRAGFLIQQPTLLRIGDADVIPDNDPDKHGFASKIVANWFGVPIVAAWWSLRYRLKTIPSSTVGVAPSPLPA